MSQKKILCIIYDFVLGCILSHPGLHVARGPQVGHPRHTILLVRKGYTSFILEYLNLD